MHVLNIVTSPRKDQSASHALVDAFLREYLTQADDIVVDTLDVWQEWLPEFEVDTINAKYKGVSGDLMTPAEVTAWEKIRELASRLSCQRNMLFTFDGRRYGPLARHQEGIYRSRSRAKRRGWI